MSVPHVQSHVAPPGERLPDFVIGEGGPVSGICLQQGLSTFQDAMRFVKRMPYGRNQDKEDPFVLFRDGCGTCGTKHALLKRLADENGFPDLKLMTGIFRMHGHNTPAVAETLSRHRLSFIPEAHNYLRYQGHIMDCTFARGEGIPDFEQELLEETATEPGQIGADKVSYHKAWLAAWLGRHPEVARSLDELWAIREQCIQDLSARH